MYGMRRHRSSCSNQAGRYGKISQCTTTARATGTSRRPSSGSRVSGTPRARSRPSGSGLAWCVTRTVLEIGSNSGFLSLAIVPLARRVVAFEINPYLVEAGRIGVAIPKDEAEAIKKKFEDAGAKVEIK